MLENVKLARYLTPTPIQAYCMPAIYQSRDIVACAQTGEISTPPIFALIETSTADSLFLF